MTPSLTSMAATRRTTSRAITRCLRARPLAAMSSTSSSGPLPPPPPGKESKTPFEMEELKKVAEKTLGEQKALVSQKWEEIKASWAENKSADDASKAHAQVDNSEW